MSYEGDFYTCCRLNVWPKPYQKPHPKMYLVGTGSLETVRLAAELGMGYSSEFVPISKQLKTFADLREQSPRYGHTFTRGGRSSASCATWPRRTAPAGLRVKETPTTEVFLIPGEKIPEMLVHHF
jgi:alkanesulfonate monooxygenase SsuD/methylene tetrahydromethanopterin reductase-like flavin-dependent oxidoreductase (luciferase family)